MWHGFLQLAMLGASLASESAGMGSDAVASPWWRFQLSAGGMIGSAFHLSTCSASGMAQCSTVDEGERFEGLEVAPFIRTALVLHQKKLRWLLAVAAMPVGFLPAGPELDFVSGWAWEEPLGTSSLVSVGLQGHLGVSFPRASARQLYEQAERDCERATGAGRCSYAQIPIAAGAGVNVKWTQLSESYRRFYQLDLTGSGLGFSGSASLNDAASEDLDGDVDTRSELRSIRLQFHTGFEW